MVAFRGDLRVSSNIFATSLTAHGRWVNDWGKPKVYHADTLDVGLTLMGLREPQRSAFVSPYVA